MKLLITDKFLWEVYNFIEKTKPITDFLLSNSYKKSKILLRDQNPVFEKYRKEKGREEFSRFIYYLKRNNCIKVENLRGKKGVILTKKGLNKALKASFKMENKNKRKDGKWIMIIFDIPKYNNKARNLLRSILYNLGYKILQQSVWITPYDVYEKTEKILQLNSLDKYVKIFFIEEI